ncbi:MAG: hypothetical protein R2854_02050 [Caldilineaceae bacterium]
MRLLGVDPFAESPFRSYLGSDDAEAIQPDFLTDMLTRPNSVLLSTDVATRYGLNTGDTLTVRVGGRTQALEIIGLMEPSNDLSRRAWTACSSPTSPPRRRCWTRWAGWTASI